MKGWVQRGGLAHIPLTGMVYQHTCSMSYDVLTQIYRDVTERHSHMAHGEDAERSASVRVRVL